MKRRAVRKWVAKTIASSMTCICSACECVSEGQVKDKEQRPRWRKKTKKQIKYQVYFLSYSLKAVIKSNASVATSFRFWWWSRFRWAHRGDQVRKLEQWVCIALPWRVYRRRRRRKRKGIKRKPARVRTVQRRQILTTGSQAHITSSLLNDFCPDRDVLFASLL